MPANSVLEPLALERLACPECHTGLRRDGSTLRCASGHSYAISNNVPVLLRRDALHAIESARGSAENVRLRRALARNSSFLKIVDLIRPPHPFAFMRWRKSRRVREAFAAAVTENGPSSEAVFLDIGSGILGGHNSSGLSAFIRERTVALEIDTVSGVGVAADAHDLPWSDSVMDGVLIQGVLEHVENPERVVAEIYRVLKPGAPVISEVPFLQHYHLDPLDFRRWTSYGFDRLFERFERLDSGVCAGPASALTDLLTEFPALLFSSPAMYWATKTLFGWIFSPIQLLDALWSARPRAHVAAAAVYFLGVKPRS